MKNVFRMAACREYQISESIRVGPSRNDEGIATFYRFILLLWEVWFSKRKEGCIASRIRIHVKLVYASGVISGTVKGVRFFRHPLSKRQNVIETKIIYWWILFQTGFNKSFFGGPRVIEINRIVRSEIAIFLSSYRSFVPQRREIEAAGLPQGFFIPVIGVPMARIFYCFQTPYSSNSLRRRQIHAINRPTAP